ncbi:hypothetical protein BO443_70004 [Burkholderia orbicola]
MSSSALPKITATSAGSLGIHMPWITIAAAAAAQTHATTASTRPARAAKLRLVRYFKVFGLSGVVGRIGRPGPERARHDGRVTLARRARACPCDEPMPATQAGHREIERM